MDVGEVGVMEVFAGIGTGHEPTEQTRQRGLHLARLSERFAEDEVRARTIEQDVEQAPVSHRSAGGLQDFQQPGVLDGPASQHAGVADRIGRCRFEAVDEV